MGVPFAFGKQHFIAGHRAHPLVPESLFTAQGVFIPFRIPGSIEAPDPAYQYSPAQFLFIFIHISGIAGSFCLIDHLLRIQYIVDIDKYTVRAVIRNHQGVLDFPRIIGPQRNGPGIDFNR